MARGRPLLHMVVVLGAVGVACHPATLLTRDEMRMSAAEHEKAASDEDAHTPSELGGMPGLDHRKRAEAHRAAAQALRQRESQACAGKPDTVVGYPFASAGVVAAEPIREPWSRARAPSGRGQPPPRLVGARITVHTALEPDVFESYLSCRAAHVRATGDDGTDPTAVHGARVMVTRRDRTLLEVEIRADEETRADDVLRRAQRLVAR